MEEQTEFNFVEPLPTMEEKVNSLASKVRELLIAETGSDHRSITFLKRYFEDNNLETDQFFWDVYKKISEMQQKKTFDHPIKRAGEIPKSEPQKPQHPGKPISGSDTQRQWEERQDEKREDEG